MKALMMHMQREENAITYVLVALQSSQCTEFMPLIHPGLYAPAPEGTLYIHEHFPGSAAIHLSACRQWAFTSLTASASSLCERTDLCISVVMSPWEAK